MAFYGFLQLLFCSILNNFLNMNNGIILPSLPISILYGISMVFPPACICSFAVIKDQFLFKWTESKLTVSSLPWLISCTSSTYRLVHSSLSSALVHLLEMVHLSASCTCFAIAWTLPQHMDPTTIPTRASLTWHALYMSYIVFFLPFGDFHFVELVWFSYIIWYSGLSSLHLYSFCPY